MFTLIGRDGEEISVPGPVSHESDSAGPMYVEPVSARAAQPVLGLDRQEAARVVLEVVDPQDHDLVLVGGRPDRLAAGGRARTPLGTPASMICAVRRSQVTGPSIVGPRS